MKRILQVQTPKANGLLRMKKAGLSPRFFEFLYRLYDQEELNKEDRRDDVGQRRNFFSSAGKQANDRVRDHADTDGVSDRTRDRHGDEHEEYREGLGNVVGGIAGPCG